MTEHDEGFDEWLKNCKLYQKGNVFSEILKEEFWDCWCKAIEFSRK